MHYKSKNENSIGRRDWKERMKMTFWFEIQRNRGRRIENTHQLCNILPPPSGKLYRCTAPSIISESFSEWKAETGNIDSCAVAILGLVSLSILAPVYMMEHVKPQHSFSRVRPVLVKGEEVCWALDGTRLVGTPAGHGNHTESNRGNKNCVL